MDADRDLVPNKNPALSNKCILVRMGSIGSLSRAIVVISNFSSELNFFFGPRLFTEVVLDLEGEKKEERRELINMCTYQNNECTN